MGKSINENSKLLGNTNINYGSILSTTIINAGEENKLQSFSTKKIEPFSLFPSPSNYLQEKIANLRREQVEESAPKYKCWY
ncbi:MAG TPA: hypothetical protein VGH95_00890 [Candidatus Aquirickettsiella sp.]|jgi:hypothetical protein